MSRSAAGAEGRSWLAAIVQRHSIPFSVGSVVLYAVSTCLVAVATVGGWGGGDTTEALALRIDWVLLWWGVGVFLLAGLIGALREWAQRWVDRGQRLAAAQFRTAVTYALRPIASQIALMQGLSKVKRRARLEVVAAQVVGSMQLILTDVSGLRAVVYELATPALMTPMIRLGREQEPAKPFERHPSGEPDPAFEALENARSQLIPDIRVEERRQASARHRPRLSDVHRSAHRGG